MPEAVPKLAPIPFSKISPFTSFFSQRLTSLWLGHLTPEKGVLKMNSLMEKIVSLCKRRGFIFPSSEIYGGIGGFWDWGPLGVLLKNNLKTLWWKEMVQERNDIFGLDASIIMNPKVWEASGHTTAFTDPLVDCRKCKRRFRADHLVEKLAKEEEGVTTSADIEKLKEALTKVKCPVCGGELTEVRKFNLLVPTYLGVVEDEKAKTYLRGETCQGEYVDFKLVLETMRAKIPFGIAQIGKAFRNEITYGDFVFRSREFEQMEMQWFCQPPQIIHKLKTNSSRIKTPAEWFNFWSKERMRWYEGILPKKNFRFRKHKKEEMPHYAKDAGDIEYKTPFNFKEFEGIHNRGDWDLLRHSKYSGKDLSYFDEDLGQSYIPWVIETSAGVDRLTLMVLLDSYQEFKGGRTITTKATKEVEIALALPKALAPIKVAVLPLIKKEKKLVDKAVEIHREIKPHFMTQYDEVDSIGRRYRRQDEIGTPYCVTIDFETLKAHSVTVRDRDTMAQDRIKIKELVSYLKEKLK